MFPYYNKKLNRWFKSKRTSNRYIAARRLGWLGLDRRNNIFANIFSAAFLLVICAGLVKIIIITPALGFSPILKVIVISFCGYMLARGFYTFFCFANEKNKAVKRVRRLKRI